MTEAPPTPPAGPSVGASLRAAREERGLSVEDVARATRMRSALVRDIEGDAFDTSGGAVYARGHIRNVAAAVGLDPRPLVAEFDATHGGTPQPVPVVLLPDPVARRASERRGPNWYAAMLTAAGVLVLLLVVGLIGRAQNDTGQQAGARQTAGAPSARPAPTGGVATAPPPSSAAPPSPGADPSQFVAQKPPADGVTVRVTIAGTSSWVRVSDPANTVLFQGLLDQGAVRDFSNPEQLRLTLGNAGAVQLTVNGRDVGSPGAMGEVKRVVFDASSPGGAAG